MRKFVLPERDAVPMTERTIQRFTAAAGAASIVFVIAAFLFLGSYPDANASGEDVVRFVTSHRASLLAVVYLFGLSLAVMLAFLAGLWALLRAGEEGTGLLSTLGFAGGVVWVSVVFAGFVLLMALAYRPASDPRLARTLLDGAVLMPNLSGFPTAVNLVGFAAVLLSKSAFPRWLGWFAIGVAAVHLVSAGAVAMSGLFSPSVASGLIAPLLYYTWVLVACILLWRRSGLPASAAAPGFKANPST